MKNRHIALLLLAPWLVACGGAASVSVPGQEPAEEQPSVEQPRQSRVLLTSGGGAAASVSYRVRISIGRM